MPNWKSAADYKFTRTLKRAGWAWEFMRRNPEYRREYVWATQSWKEATWLSFPDAQPVVASQEDSNGIAVGYGAKWGQRGPIADPNTDKPPKFLIFPLQTGAASLNAFFAKSVENDAIVQHPDFATLTFDLHESIPQQMKIAATVLRRRQRGKKIRKPVHKGQQQWGLYLRILDATEAGADNKSIVSSIQTYLDANKSAPGKSAGLKRLDKHRKQAAVLRDDPLSLIR